MHQVYLTLDKIFVVLKKKFYLNKAESTLYLEYILINCHNRQYFCNVTLIQSFSFYSWEEVKWYT